MTLTEHFLEELERESARTKRVLAHVPANQSGWKPHEKSMAFGPLVQMVATMPSWFSYIINMNALDVAPPAGSDHRPQPMETSEALLAGHDKAMEQARGALKGTKDDFLMTTSWKLLAGGQVVVEQPRYQVLRDTINHWAHHRGQLTVYLRLLGAPVAAVYGPSADDTRFL